MGTALITFGCSWTYGVACHYASGMLRAETLNSAWDDDKTNLYSFRAILSKKYNLTNLNFSAGGSSNQRQFRLAKEFFLTDEYKKINDSFDKIIVLWGITSTARNELYSIDKKDYINFQYHRPTVNWPFNKLMLQHCYDLENSVNELSLEMKLWDEIFENRGIKNLWFDTFNHHNYSYANNMVFANENKRDLLSILAKNAGLAEVDDGYHHSVWHHDTDRVTYLVDKKILNPYSKHPGREGHNQISELLSPEIEKLIS
jgi:hypothetical protein